MKLSKTLILIFFNSIILSAQEKKPALIKPVVSGSIIVSVAGNAVYTSFGGPGIKMISGKWSAGLHMMPSLRFLEDKPRPLITPTLGGGLLIGYKRLIIGVPFYYLATQAKWKTGIGVGVKIGK